jgi:hypothetical protein
LLCWYAVWSCEWLPNDTLLQTVRHHLQDYRTLQPTRIQSIFSPPRRPLFQCPNSFLFFQELSNHGVGLTDKISQYKFLWLRLSYLTQDLGSSMGLSYVVIIVLCFSVQVTSCYGCLSSIVQGFKIISLALASASTVVAVSLFCICNAAKFATDEVSNCSHSEVFLLLISSGPILPALRKS